MKSVILFGLFLTFSNCEVFTTEDESDDIAYQGFEIYRKIYNSDTNLVYSPLSFRVLYSILYQTSFGQTEIELRNQLFANTHEADKPTIRLAQSSALDRILTSDKIKLANKVYLAAGTTLNHDFKSLVAQYKSDVEQVDFSKSAEVANQMNQWVEANTNQLIKNVISADSITSDSQLLLVNTLYFKSNWLTPFTNNLVLKSNFHNIDGTKSEIEFIQDEDYYRVGNNNKLKVDVLELKYEAGSNFKFWIIVPHDGLSLAELKSQLSSDFMHVLNNSISSLKAQIKFPIFSVESEIDGRTISKGLFERAELNMLENSDPLIVNLIKHKTKIIVNTAGTEATAATYGKLQPVSADIEEPVAVIANRPFLFMVLTQDRIEPIFVGHYVTANKV